MQGRLGVLHGAPRLGQIEQYPVEVVDVDSVVGVAYLDVEGQIGAEKALDVAAGAVGEIGSDLVAGHVPGRPDRAQQRHRQRARADPRLEHPGAREQVGEDRGSVRGPSDR